VPIPKVQKLVLVVVQSVVHVALVVRCREPLARKKKKTAPLILRGVYLGVQTMKECATHAQVFVLVRVILVVGVRTAGMGVAMGMRIAGVARLIAVAVLWMGVGAVGARVV
jgi:hypothetical protein